MFDERRHRVAGIDKSYPLQPISVKTTPNSVGRQVKSTVNIVTKAKEFKPVKPPLTDYIHCMNGKIT